MTVRLTAVIEVLDYPGEWECYLSPSTGDIIAVTEEEREYVDDPAADISDLPAWLQESVLKCRTALASSELIALPSKFDIDEWDIMRRYADHLHEPLRGEVLTAIHGKGAFRLFRMTMDRLGLRDDWFTFRDDTVKRIAIDWLNDHSIEYTDE
jgi:hypothetical protein